MSAPIQGLALPAANSGGPGALVEIMTIKFETPFG